MFPKLPSALALAGDGPGDKPGELSFGERLISCIAMDGTI